MLVRLAQTFQPTWGDSASTPASCFSRSRPMTRDHLETFVAAAESWARRPEIHTYRGLSNIFALEIKYPEVS